jgi:glycosyltransferase involved in cell wall biosynthesis
MNRTVSSRLRVVIVATVIDFGGIERVLLHLLEQVGSQVEFFPVFFTTVSPKQHRFFERIDALSIPYETILVNSSRLKYFNPIRNIGEVISRMRGRSFDLVHSHGYRANFIGFIVSKFVGLPLVSTCHGYIANDKRLSAYNKLDMFLLRYFARIMAVSDKMKEDLVAAGVPGEKIRVIGNAVEIGSITGKANLRVAARSQLGIGESEFVFGFVGRLSIEKGVGYLIDGLSRRLQAEHSWRVVLVGDGPCRPALEETVRRYGLERQVIFAGFQSDTTPWYSAMDAFVLPSLTEGTPMALLEAMANGLPAIATSVGGVPALVVNGMNGILVSPADPPGLLDAMSLVAKDGALSERLSVNAMRTIQANHGLDRWAREVIDFYVEAAQHTQWH